MVITSPLTCTESVQESTLKLGRDLKLAPSVVLVNKKMFLKETSILRHVRSLSFPYDFLQPIMLNHPDDEWHFPSL